MVSRRRLLALSGSLIVGAGCTGTTSESSPRVVCSAGILAGDGGDVIFGLTPQVSSYGQGDAPVVELTVPVRRSVLADEGVATIDIRSGEETEYTIPVDPQNDEPVGSVQRYDADDVVEYGQSLGHVPQNGRLRLVALDAEGQEVDAVRLEFRCYRQAEESTA